MEKFVIDANKVSHYGEGKCNDNLLVVGSTGSGKTMSVTIPQVLNAEEDSYVITVTKRDQLDLMVKSFKSKGYDTFVIDLSSPKRGNADFDPMNYIENNSDAKEFASAVIGVSKNLEEARDPYWDDAAKSLICAEVAGLFEKAAAEGKAKPTLADLFRLHQRLALSEGERGGFTKSTLDSFFEELKREDPSSYAYRCWGAVKGLAPKTVSCILSTVNTAYSNVFVHEAERSVRVRWKANFSLIGEKKTAFIIYTSPVDKCQQAFANILYAQVFRTLFKEAEKREGCRLKVPVHIVCDDFACGCKIPNFPEYISVMRSCGITATVLLQSLAQLKSMYGPDGARVVMDNCDQILYLGSNNLDSCTEMAKRANVSLKEMVELPIGEAYAFRRGEPPRKTVRYQTYSDKRYLEIAENLYTNKEKGE